MAPSASRPPADEPDAVDALLAALDHPSAAVIQALRSTIRGVDPRIVESVKWNAPSFALAEHFATFHLRQKQGVMVVLHRGARARPDRDLRASISDPAGLLEWKGPDRATVVFREVADVEASEAAFVEVLRQWIDHVG